MAIASINPATGEILQTFAELSDGELERRLARAESVFDSHRRTKFAERSEKMLRAADILESEKQAFGRIMSLEMGKPLRAAVDEAAKCATACRYYAEHAERLLADELVATKAARSLVRYQPLGPVLAVMPWNFPFWQVFRFAAPALMAGNVGLLKHASNVPQCAVAIEDIFRRAGFAEGTFQTLLIGSGRVEGLLADPRVRAVSLTGSELAGSQVAAAAGRHIKKSVLELGGSDPFIVRPTADLPRAIKAAVQARTVNNGQSCIAAKRFIFDAQIADRFVPPFVAAMHALKVGDPLDPATDIGPLATPQIADELDQQVRRTVAAGARLLTGGHKLAGPGNFYAPTVLADIPADSPGATEEFFGPVALVFQARDFDESIRLANASSFGLGSSIWTSDIAEQDRFADEIEAGLAFVNAVVASDTLLPFGGIKRSGYGRELSVQGIREFVNIKTVYVGG